MVKKKQKIFILANGEKMKPALLKNLARGRKILAVDGAAKQAKRLGWKIDFVAGDFDSLNPNFLQSLKRKGTRIVPLPDQNFTDLEKTVEWCIQEGFRDIRIAQALGKRMDHSLTNLALLKRFYRKGIHLEIHTNFERIEFLENSKIVSLGAIGRTIGVIPSPEASVTSRGLNWEMKNSLLHWGKSQSVSNFAKSRKIELKVKGSVIFVEGSSNQHE